MDVEREDSAHESVADNEATANNGNSDSSGDFVSKNPSNGSVSIDHVKQLSDADRFGKQVQDKELVNLTPVMAVKNSHSDSPSSSPGTIKKGQGLRKWRRIKREVTKEGCVVVDSSKLSKRGFSNAGSQGRPIQFSSDMRQSSEGSVSSTHAMVWRLGGPVDGFAVGDSGPPLGPFFATAADSENSDDRSSKSSTAASVPKMRYGGPPTTGQVKDRNKIANVNCKNLGSSVQEVPHGKVQTEISKKARGEQVNIEKETSHSSMESDSRSSNFIFMQDSRYVTRNGRQNGGSINYGGENDPQTLANPRQVTEQLRTGYGKNSDGESEDVSQGDLNAGSSCSVKEENSGNQGCSTDQDDPVEPIHMLQAAQEAFEKEIQNIREIGKEDSLAYDLNLESCLPSELIFDGLEVNGSGGDNCSRSLHTLESELEALFKQKIEADVEYLTISKTIQDLIVPSVDQISQLEEKVISEQSQIMNKLIDAESKAVNLKRDAKKLEKDCEDVVIANKTVKLQSSVCKYTTCFLIQLILLVVTIRVLILQLSPQSAGVVPT